MLRRDFEYQLPADLIAQRPSDERSASRLLHLDGAADTLEDRVFRDLPGLLRPGDLLVFNDTRVIPARVYGVKPSGGRVEVLVDRVIGPAEAWVRIRASKALRPGDTLRLEGGVAAVVRERSADRFRLSFDDPRPLPDLLDEVGHVPLPPYIRRGDEPADRARYQTVYGCRPGAIAAPTAGLHFDVPILERLRERGVDSAFVTLHVGAGTFQPVREDRVEEHVMHPEQVDVGDEVCAKVRRARRAGGRVVAVGTTVVRSLESAARDGELTPLRGETDLFILPGFRFRVVDALITNFHLPGSTLLMLVCAFGGYQRVMDAYRHAVERCYRFYSYGDAMLVVPPALG
ncbi:MAG: tRNA preQ1(34) S-adenosylmethionine ribosyltransferase-isomerase QueA [Gammaproteobacteria bacterium]